MLKIVDLNRPLKENFVHLFGHAGNIIIDGAQRCITEGGDPEDIEACINAVVDANLKDPKDRKRAKQILIPFIVVG